MCTQESKHIISIATAAATALLRKFFCCCLLASPPCSKGICAEDTPAFPPMGGVHLFNSCCHSGFCSNHHLLHITPWRCTHGVNLQQQHHARGAGHESSTQPAELQEHAALGAGMPLQPVSGTVRHLLHNL